MGPCCCPQANIVLIEANSSTPRSACATPPPPIPRCLGGIDEFGLPGIRWRTSLDPLFTTPAGHAGVTYVASAGDWARLEAIPRSRRTSSPSAAPSVPLAESTSETAWASAGGAPAGARVLRAGTELPDRSATVGLAPDARRGLRCRPLQRCGGVRLVPLRDLNPRAEVGGTSLSAPCWSGLIGIADQLRASQDLAPLDGPTQTLPALYGLPATDFHDITGGNNGYPAGPGFDMCTGLGTPVTSSLVPDLAACSATPARDRHRSTTQPVFGQSMTFTASVLGKPGSGTPTGTVTFRDGSRDPGHRATGRHRPGQFHHFRR